MRNQAKDIIMISTHDNEKSCMRLINCGNGQHNFHYRHKKESKRYPARTISFVITHENNQHEVNIVRSAIQTLLDQSKGRGEYYFDIYTCHNSMRVGYDMVSKILSTQTATGYCAIVTTGTLPAMCVDTLCSSRDSTLPHLFANVADIERIERYSLSEKFCTSYATGVKRGNSAFSHLIKFLGMANPEKKKRALLPVDSNTSQPYYPSSAPVRDRYYSALHNYNFSTEDVLVRSYSDIGHIIEKFGHEIEYLFIPPQCDTLNAHIQQLSSQCKTQGIVLASNNRTNVSLGASIGIGNDGFEYGQSLGGQLFRIAHQGETPDQIRLVVVNDQSTIVLNKEQTEKSKPWIPMHKSTSEFSLLTV